MELEARLHDFEQRVFLMRTGTRLARKRCKARQNEMHRRPARALAKDGS
jgi:hypothetical protein